MAEVVRRTRRFTINPKEAAALDRLLDAYLATDNGDPGWLDLTAFESRIEHAQMDHAAYETEEVECTCPTDDYCPKCHPRWHAKLIETEATR